MGPVIHSLLDAKTKTERESAERESGVRRKLSRKMFTKCFNGFAILLPGIQGDVFKFQDKQNCEFSLKNICRNGNDASGIWITFARKPQLFVVEDENFLSIPLCLYLFSQREINFLNKKKLDVYS